MTFLIDLLQILIQVAWLIIIVQFVMSVLLAFNVINLLNEYVRAVWNMLTVITEPFYRPIRRILPDFGPLDFSPMVVILILIIIENAVIPALERAMIGVPV